MLYIYNIYIFSKIKKIAKNDRYNSFHVLMQKTLWYSLLLHNDKAGESHSQNFPGQWGHRQMYSLTSQWCPFPVDAEGTVWNQYSLALVFLSVTCSPEVCR